MSETGPRVRVAAVVVRDGSALAVRHEKDGEIYWLFPGGGVDFAESLADALTREVFEETGVTVRVGELVALHDSIPPDGHRHVLNLYFRAAALDGTPRRGQDPRVVEARYLPLEELARVPFRPDVREALWPVLTGDAPGFLGYLGKIWRD